MSELVNGMKSDEIGGVSVIESYTYTTLFPISGITTETGYTGMYVSPSASTNYFIDIYDDNECLYITGITISDWFINYLNSLATTGYTGYTENEITNIETRIIKAENNDSFYILGHINSFSGVTLNTDEWWAIIDHDTEELWFSGNTGNTKYYYEEVDECGSKTGRLVIAQKNINPNSNTRFQTKYTELEQQILTPIATAMLSATGISETGATLNGSITSVGSISTGSTGFYYGIYSNPSNKDMDAVAIVNDNLAVESINIDISGLKPGTTYYARTYAINSIGTTYGNEITFNTL